jgi:predicted Zn-dependent protease
MFYFKNTPWCLIAEITAIWPERLGVRPRTLAMEIVARFGGVWKDAAATRRVSLVGKSPVRYCGRQGLDFEFCNLNSDTTNACSAPGGHGFITRGFYGLVGAGDDMLAGVSGRAIPRVIQGDAL